jgi:hypothetical protein
MGCSRKNPLQLVSYEAFSASSPTLWLESGQRSNEWKGGSACYEVLNHSALLLTEFPFFSLFTIHSAVLHPHFNTLRAL